MALDNQIIVEVETTKAVQSVKELKAEINSLRDKLVTLDETTDEYQQVVNDLIQDETKLNNVMKAGKEAVTAATGSYNALVNEMSALKKVWRTVTSEAERDKIGVRISEINDELKKMDASLGNYQRNVGNYENSFKKALLTPQQELKKLRQELAQLEIGTEEYNKTFQRMSELTHIVTEQQEKLRWSSSDLGDMLGNLTSVSAGVAAGFSAINALMGLMGEGNEDVQKAMLRTQQFMALVQGLSKLEELRDRIEGLWTGIKNFSLNLIASNKNLSDFNKAQEGTAGATTKVAGTVQAEAAALNTSTEAKKADTIATEEHTVAIIDEQVIVERSIENISRDIVVREERLAAMKEEYAQMVANGVANTEDALTLANRIKIMERVIAGHQHRIEKLNQERDSIKTGTKAVNDNTKAENKNTTAQNNNAAATEAGGNAAAGAAVKTGLLTKAVKALRVALASIGIGLVITALSALIKLIGKGIGAFWEWISNAKAIKAAFDAETESINNLNKAMERHHQMMAAQGKNTYDMYIQQLKDLIGLDAKLMKHYDNAIKHYKEGSEEAKEAQEKWEENNEKTADTIFEIIASIESMAVSIEKADSQKGMTQLEKDTAELNEQFASAIALLELMKEQGKIAAETADDYINRLKDDLPKALEQLKGKVTNTGGKSVWDSEEEEIKRLLETLENYGKTEEQILTETFNKQYALFKKHHKDTTILEKKYQEELLKIRETYAEKNRKLQELGLQNDRDFILKGNEAWYKADIALKDRALKNLKKGINESDEEFKARKIKAEAELLQAEQSLTEYQNKQEETYLENVRNNFSKGEREWYQADINLKQAMYDNLIMGLDESLEAFEARKAAALKELQEAKGALVGYDLYEEYTGIQVKISEADQTDFIESYKARIEAAEWYRDNLIQAEDETNAEFALRQSEANAAVLQADWDLVNARLEIYQNLSDGIGSIMGSVADIMEENINMQVENGEITEEEAEKQFEVVKGWQIAQATIETISGAIAAFMGMVQTYKGVKGAILGAIQAAVVTAAGIANIQKIKNTQFGSSSLSTNGVSAMASPIVASDYSPEYTQNITGEIETDNLANAISQQPVYVSVVDIENAQNRVKSRTAEVTF